MCCGVTPLRGGRRGCIMPPLREKSVKGNINGRVCNWQVSGAWATTNPACAGAPVSAHRKACFWHPIAEATSAVPTTAASFAASHVQYILHQHDVCNRLSQHGHAQKTARNVFAQTRYVCVRPLLSFPCARAFECETVQHTQV